MRLTPWGAVRTVTGSMHLVETGGVRLLLDCGLFQGRRAEFYEINSRFPFSPASIDAVVLSHAHLDHCGNLPTLVRQGFDGPIYCTPATGDVAAVVLRDSAKVQHQDVTFVNKIRRSRGEPPMAPLYTHEEAERAIHHLTSVRYGRAFSVGAARGPEAQAAGAQHLAAAVTETIGRGGKVLIPALAVGRTQDLTYTLRELGAAGRVPAVPTYVDSPMAVDVTDIYRVHEEGFDEETRARLSEAD